MAELVPEARLGSVEAAGRIAELCGDLVRLAEVNRWSMLAYLLGMARLEAEAISRGEAGGRDARPASGRA